VPRLLAHRLEDRHVTTQTVHRAQHNVRLSVRIDRQERLVALAGELDFAAVPLLFDGLARFGKPGDIIIDLSELTFIDAAGLGAAVHVRNTQLANGFDLHIVRANPLITRVFRLGGLSQLLYPTH
jgi:anti-anti-sigma factor